MTFGMPFKLARSFTTSVIQQKLVIRQFNNSINVKQRKAQTGCHQITTDFAVL